MSLTSFVNFAPGEPCWICGRAEPRGKNRCAHSPDGTVVMCGRQPAGSFKRARNGDFWLHRITPDRRDEPLPAWSAARKATKPKPVPRVDFRSFARRCEKALGPVEGRRLADSLGLTVGSLRRLGAGWATAAELLDVGTRCRGAGAWTFPLQDGTGRVVGIRLRSEDGGKFAMDGSDGSGLIVPRGLHSGGMLLAAEGPTSCAALLVMGLQAAGRPNNRAGGAYLIELARRMGTGLVAVVGDNDRKTPTPRDVERPCANCRSALPRRPLRQSPCPVCDGRGVMLELWPGLEGAVDTAARLFAVGVESRVVLPPGPGDARGQGGIKDAREWLAAGYGAADVIDRVNQAGAGGRAMRDAI